MSRPDVNIERSNGNIGGADVSADGTSALIGTGISVAGKLVLGEPVGPILSPEDAVLYGIDADYDSTNKVLMYQHIVDFYLNAPVGTKLYLMVVPETVTLEDMADKTEDYASKLLASAQGAIKMISFSRVPAASYAATVVSGFDDDAKAAVIKAQELYASEWDSHRPVGFLIEGREFQGNPATVFNHRDPALSLRANAVQMIISADTDVSSADTQYAGYANVAYAMGVHASRKVSRNMGRIKSGSLPGISESIGLSDGSLLTTYSEAKLDALYEAGYTFIWTIAQYSGYYFCNDFTLTPASDDYFRFSRLRPANKAASLLRQTYVVELLDDLELETDGTLPIEMVKYFEAEAKEKIELNMIRNDQNEISAVSVYVDPDQNVGLNNEWKAVAAMTPRGSNDKISVKLGYSL